MLQSENWKISEKENTFIYLSKGESSILLFFHQVRLGGGKPPIASHLREMEELRRADNLLLTVSPF